MDKRIHFKLAYNEETYRFSATELYDEIVHDLKAHASTITNNREITLKWRGSYIQEEYLLCDGESDVVVESDAYLHRAIEHAKASVAGTDEHPCVGISIADVVSEMDVDEHQVPDIPVDAPLVDSTAESLQQLLDLVLEHRDADTNQFLSSVDGTKMNKLQAHCEVSFETDANSTQLIVQCDSPLDIFIWKYCAITACANAAFNASCKASHRSISIKVDTTNAKRVLDFFKPLAQRMHLAKVDFSEAQINPLLTDFCRAPADDEMEPLQPLLDSVLEMAREERRELESYSEKLKVNQFSLPKICLKMEPRDDTKFQQISCSFSSNIDRDLWIWRSCVLTAIDKLGIEVGCIKINDQKTSVETSKEDLEKVLKFIKPLAQTAHFNTINFIFTEPNLMRACYESMNGCSVYGILFEGADWLTTYNSPIFIDCVKIFKPSVVMCELYADKEAITFLLPQLADLTTAIIIRDNNPHSTALASVYTSMLLEMFLKKCRYLGIHSRAAEVSHAQAEQIVQLCHHLDKRFALQITADRGFRIANNTLGDYKVEVTDVHTREILIEHLAIEPKFADL